MSLVLLAPLCWLLVTAPMPARGAVCADDFAGFKAALADAGADNPEFKTYATILSSLNSCDDLIHSPLLAMARSQGPHSPGGPEYHVTNLRPFLEAI